MRPPDADDVARILAFGRDLVGESDGMGHLLVHCHAGVSRSTASMALIIAQARPDATAPAVLGEVLRVRPQECSTSRLDARAGDREDSQTDRGGSGGCCAKPRSTRRGCHTFSATVISGYLSCRATMRVNSQSVRETTG
jgi:hypothetical protein